MLFKKATVIIAFFLAIAIQAPQALAAGGSSKKPKGHASPKKQQSVHHVESPACRWWHRRQQRLRYLKATKAKPFGIDLTVMAPAVQKAADGVSLFMSYLDDAVFGGTEVQELKDEIHNRRHAANINKINKAIGDLILKDMAEDKYCGDDDDNAQVSHSKSPAVSNSAEDKVLQLVGANMYEMSQDYFETDYNYDRDAQVANSNKAH